MYTMISLTRDWTSDHRAETQPVTTQVMPKTTSHGKCKVKKCMSVSLSIRSWVHGCVSSNLLGRRSPGGDCVLSKSTDVNEGHIRLNGCTFTMTC